MRLVSCLGQTLSYTQQLDEEERKKDSLEDEYRSQKASLDMLGDFENNLAKLQQITVESGQRLVALAEEWEKHRQPMLQVCFLGCFSSLDFGPTLPYFPGVSREQEEVVSKKDGLPSEA